MPRPTVEIDHAACAKELAVGGVFAVGCALPLATDCELVVRGAAGELRLDARVVFVDARGAGLEIVGFGAELKARLEALAEPPLDAEPDADDAPDGEPPKQLHERLRGLTLAEQIKQAHSGDPTERILLERMYGKNVWEALLRNSRLTAPEVTRLARMGQLPKPLLEIIVGNSAWLGVPEVRRALLKNPRLGVEQIARVLRHLTRQELRLAPSQVTYPRAVRDAAKRLLTE